MSKEDYGLNRIINEMIDKRLEDFEYEILKRSLKLDYKTAKRLAETGDPSLVAEELKKTIDDLI